VNHPCFIVFDGNEGCGKSTQAKLLKQYLESIGKSVLLVRDPGTTRVGELIRSILLNPEHAELSMRTEMLLYMAARAQMMKEVITPALTAGTTVICDRFVSSTLAYQLGGDGLSADDIRQVATVAIGDTWPDITLILDMPVEQSLARVQRAKDRIEQRPLEYHAIVRQNYLAQARQMPDRYHIINAACPPEQVQLDIRSALIGYI
jgi:dTMP kinase